MPAWADVEQRIRHLLVEDTPDFFPPNDLKEWYDEGVADQHRLVFSNLRMWEERARRHNITLEVDPYEHDYTRLFLTTDPLATAAADQDYALPATLYRLASINIEPVAGRPIELPRVAFRNDWLTENVPQFRPAAFQPCYAITPEGQVRLYMPSGDTLPTAIAAFNVRHFRDVLKTGTALTDVPDPFNNGPVRYTVAMGKQNQDTDPTPWFAQAQGEAQAILPPPPPEPPVRAREELQA